MDDGSGAALTLKHKERPPLVNLCRRAGMRCLGPRPPFQGHTSETWGPGTPGPNSPQPIARGPLGCSPRPVSMRAWAGCTAGVCTLGAPGEAWGGCVWGVVTESARGRGPSMQLSQCGWVSEAGASRQKPAFRAALFQVVIKVHSLRLEDRIYLY